MMRITTYLMVSLVIPVIGCGKPQSSEVSSQVDSAKELMRSGRVSDALKALETAKRAEPKNVEVYLLRSQLLEQSANLRAAKEEALIAHLLAPKDPTAALRAMYVSAGFSAPSEVERLSREAAALAPDNPDPHLYYGNAIVRAENPGRYDEAIDAYKEANRLAPFSPAPLIAMGRLYLRMSDAERAEAMLRNAIKILDRAPRGPMPFISLNKWVEERRACAFALAQAHSKLGNATESRKHSSDSAFWSRRASELRSLKNRAGANPPDAHAKKRLSLIESGGIWSWPP